MRMLTTFLAVLMAAPGDLLLQICLTLLKVLEILFGWLYAALSNPALVRKNYQKVRSKPSKTIEPGDTEVT